MRSENRRQHHDRRTLAIALDGDGEVAGLPRPASRFRLMRHGRGLRSFLNGGNLAHHGRRGRALLLCRGTLTEYSGISGATLFEPPFV